MFDTSEQLTTRETMSSQLVAEYEDILNTPLNAEYIDSYAEEALRKVISLLNRARQAYAVSPEEPIISPQEQEDRTCAYFGLANVPQMLDHISYRSNQIHQLDTTIAGAQVTDKVIIPPKLGTERIEEGEVKFAVNEILPKLKTVLFILQNEFDIDVDDVSQLTLIQGNVTQNMLRRTPYFMVQAPSLQRTIFVCDETGNATFVLNDERLKSNNFEAADVQGFNKDDIDMLLELDETIGQRLVFSKRFVPNLIEAIHNPVANKITEADESLGRYLAIRAPEGVLSALSIRTALGVGADSVFNHAVEELGERLGEIHQYRFGSRTAKGYTLAQQLLIYEHLESRGYFNTAPEGYANIHNMAQAWGIAHNAVGKAVELVAEELGEVGIFNAGPVSTEFFSASQQEVIRQKLEERGLFKPPAPEGFLSIAGIARALGVDHQTVAFAITDLEEKIGETDEYRFTSITSIAYSPEQQLLIHGYLSARGTLTEVAPDGVISVAEFEKDLGLSGGKSIERAIGAIGDKLGTIDIYRYGSRKSKGRGLNKEQQQLIKKYLEDDGTLIFAPEGYNGIVDISDQVGVHTGLVRKAVKVLGDHEGFGEVKRYRTSTHPNKGSFPQFSPEQQAQIRDYLRSNGYVDNNPPYGYAPAHIIAKEVGVAQATVSKVVKKLSNELGEVKKYKYKTLVTAGYSPEQQAVIKAYLASQ